MATGNTAPVFKLSAPTSAQVLHGIERVVAVFVVAAFAVWQVAPDKFSKAAGIAAVTAGITAVYQLVASTLTTL